LSHLIGTIVTAWRTATEFENASINLPELMRRGTDKLKTNSAAYRLSKLLESALHPSQNCKKMAERHCEAVI
jgi:hypothetical protein